MNYLQKVVLILFMLQGGTNLYAQLGSSACNYDLINSYNYTFDSQAEFNETWGNNSEVWEWVEDGTAASIPGAFWGEENDARPSIASPSGGGAVAIGGDTGGSLSLVGLEFEDNATVYLRFNQYFRRYQTTEAHVIVQNSLGEEQSFFINGNIASNIETSYRDQKIIDITSIAQNEVVSVTFLFNGPGYFWIIDDIGFYDDYPCLETVPERYGPILTELGYPYEVDDAGWPYVPGQMVIQFTDDASPGDIEDIGDELGLTVDGEGVPMKETCVCDSLELWFMGDTFIDPITGEGVDGNTIGILERVMGANAKPKVQGADVNYYTAAQLQAFDELLPPQDLTDSEKNDIIANNPSSPTDIRIAILDTGVDFKHPDILPYIRAKAGNCYGVDDILGYNFVHAVNNPQDDHSHGTHVAGIIAQRLTALDNVSPLACNFHIIPYKTHDNHGFSTLFDVACATYQALADDVSIINDSWGFYGTGSIILGNAINSAKAQNVLIVTAAGNDGISLNDNLLYPACDAATNKLAVASYDVNAMGILSGRSDFSNFSNIWVDIAAEGRDIKSAVPTWYPIGTTPGDCYDSTTQRACKSGTSMATPTVTAAAAIAYCERPEDYLYAIERVLSCSDDYDALMPFVNGGLALNSNLDRVCLTPLDSEPIVSAGQLLRLYPNPAQELVAVSSQTALNNGTLRLYNATGKLIQQYTFDAWLEGEERHLNLAQLPGGLYLVQLQTKDQLQTLKLMKN